MSAPRPTAAAHVPLRARLARTSGMRALKDTLATCMRYRVTGLAAEAAFFTILSLPPLIFGLAGAIGFVAAQLDVGTVLNFQGQLLSLARKVLTEDAVNNILGPTLNDVLSGGSASVISVGFLLALWSGSRALNVFVDTITIMYGLAGRRGIVATRVLSFGLYLLLLVIGIVVIPLVLAGPGFVDRILPARFEVVGDLYWPILLLASTGFLAGLYHLSVPVRTRVRTGLPGAALALLIWVGGSYLLRLALNASTGSTTIYGPLAAPIAVLIWLYVISLAVLVGAAFNTAIDDVWPWLSGISMEDRLAHADAKKNDGNALTRLRSRRRSRSTSRDTD